jgi:hypothetical protein
MEIGPIDGKDKNPKCLQSLSFPLCKQLKFMPFHREIQNNVKRGVMDVIRTELIYVKYFSGLSNRK